jgi:TPR repeat protein
MHMRLTGTMVVLALILSPIGWGADFATGEDAYNSGDYETAITVWQPLAEAGDAAGQFGMGLLYANGFGVPLDDNEALKWYGLAAEQNHANAQCNIAVMHANGWGVPQSDAEAFKWYSLAAEQGVIEAQNALAKMYFGGFGAEKDRVQAHKWFSIAAELGDLNAASKRDDLTAKLSPDELAQAAEMASTWIANYQTLHANQ